MGRSKIGFMIAVLLLVAACAPAPTAASPTPAGSSAAVATATPTDRPVLKLTIGLPTVGALQWPYYVAMEKGWYTEAKIDLEQFTVANPTQGVQGLISGSLGVYGASPDPVIKAVAETNGPLVIVRGVSDRPLYAFVVQPEIRSYADLRGKRLGVFSETSMSGMWLQMMMKEHGLERGDYELIPVGGTAAIFAALQSKGIAGGMLTQPQDLQAFGLGFKSLGLSTEVVKEIAWGSYSTSRDFASKNEEVLVRFLSVQRRASIWVNDAKNRDEAVAILVKYTKAAKTDAEQTYDLWMQNTSLTPDSSESPEAVKAMIDMMVLTKQLTQPIAVEKVFDPSYMAKAKARG